MITSDLELLRKYQRENSEEAFAELVKRHLNLVYSAALRQVRSHQLAEEVAQSAFADLARNAHRLAPGTILAAWLYQVTRRTALDVVRRESRRQLREQIATEMNAMNATAADWTHIEPLLDDAMAALDDTDRAAVLLRYFENKSLREVGATLGTSDDAAQKRVSRAVERLREFFAKRGVGIGAGGLAVVISANAVHAAPAGSAAAIVSATMAKSATASNAPVAKASLKLFAWAKIKLTVPGIASVLLSPVLSAVGSYFAVRASLKYSASVTEKQARLRFGWKLGIATVAAAVITGLLDRMDVSGHPWIFGIGLGTSMVAYVSLILFWSIAHKFELIRLRNENQPPESGVQNQINR